RSAGRARDYLLRLLREGPDDPSSPAAGAVFLAREPVLARAGRYSRIALITPRPLQGEGLDGAVGPVAGRAADHGRLVWAVAGAHRGTACRFGRKAASFGAVVVQVGRAVKEHHLSLQTGLGRIAAAVLPIPALTGVGYTRRLMTVTSVAFRAVLGHDAV